jgi:hypothetical protein
VAYITILAFLQLVIVLQLLEQGQSVRDVLVRLRKRNVPQPRGSSSVQLEGEKDTV